MTIRHPNMNDILPKGGAGSTCDGDFGEPEYIEVHPGYGGTVRKCKVCGYTIPWVAITGRHSASKPNDL
jgi:hypothetical protein